MFITIAHAGHWALGLLEVAPVAIVLAVVGWKVWTDRRAPAATEAEGVPHA
ncbi:MAG: hypothetical protein KY463_15000 [Actinobacteria bacterium]|nr:hypothetical protein [Actinomycetota bacterium]